MLIGVWLCREAFDATRALGFYLIWLALLVYSLEGLWQGRGKKAAPIAA